MPCSFKKVKIGIPFVTLSVYYLSAMHISWHGQYTLKFVTADTTIVIDPYSPAVGLLPFRSKADVVALTNPSSPDMSHLAGIQGTPLILDSPGEYALRGFTLDAISWHDSENKERSFERWRLESITLLHIGAINRDLHDQELQALEKTDIDVLFLPVGGGDGLSTKQALNLLTTIEPRMVIPIHFALPKLSKSISPVDQFAKEMGVNPRQAEKKVIIKASRLPQEGMETIILIP